MARTMQTARRSTAGRVGGIDANVVENPDLNASEIAKLKEIEQGEMQASLKFIDKRWTEKGQGYFTETIDEEIPEQINWWGKFALCLVRTMDNQNKMVIKTSLVINSQHLKDILRVTIGDYPGTSFLTKDITIDAPYHPLYHYRQELKDARHNLVDEDAIAHLDLLINFIEEQFKDTIEECKNFIDQGIMSFQHLWTILRPGSLMYASVMGQPRAFVLVNHGPCGNPPGISLNLQYLDYDGQNFGTRHMSRIIPMFSGAQKIRHFPAYPLAMHANPDALRQQLIERGRRFESYAGMHFNQYKGIAVSECERYSIDSRIVIDAKTFHRLNPNEAFAVAKLSNNNNSAQGMNEFEDSDMDVEYEDEETSDEDDYQPSANRARFLREDDDGNLNNEAGDAAVTTKSASKLNAPALTDDHCLIAAAMVRGFSFSEKRWCDFFLDKCKPVEWNASCFDQLVLPAEQKDLVQALVANHVTHSASSKSSAAGGFDDIVKGKGKGLILVLHGPPGVGKTLTAETVAEYTRRPLFSVSSGDLGTSPTALDERLTRILDMAGTWRAVLLIDEADVFLERRAARDVERNGLVSIFLRVLEYYAGILFLTSNRVREFDDAFKSRIHVPLKYADLNHASRRSIWKNFLELRGGDKVCVDDEGLDKLADTPINGRQIKNVIRTAKSLAQFHGQELDLKKLEQVIKIQLEFEAELNGANEEDHVMVNGH